MGIKIIKDEKNNQLILEGIFSLKNLNYQIKSKWDLGKDVPISMEDKFGTDKESIWSGLTTFSSGTVSRYLEFGTLLTGAKNMSLFVEGVRNVNYFTGSVDEKPIVPIRTEGGCGCDSIEVDKMLVFKDTLTLEPVELKLQHCNPKDIEDLAKHITSEISYYKRGKEPIEFFALPKCFWGISLCAAGTVLCMGLFGATGFGAALCVARGLACYAAVYHAHKLDV